MLLLMDIQDLEHSPCCTSASCMPASAPHFSGGSVLVLEQTGHSSPNSPLSSSQSANSQPTATSTTTTGHQQSQHHFIRQNSTSNNHNGRPLTSSPNKKGAHNTTGAPTNNNIENHNGGHRDQPRLHYRQGKSYRFNSHQAGGNNHNSKSGIYRRNNSVLPKTVFHPKQQQPHQSSESPPSKATLNEPNGIGPSNHISKSTCDINSGGGGKSNGNIPQQHNSTPKRNYSSRKKSKVDLPINVSKNCKRGKSFEDASTSRPKKTRRSRRRKRPYEGGEKPYRRDKRMRWTECNADEVSRLHRNCMQKGQPLAPYNTTQFIMNEHNAEKEIDFDELSGQIQQMHNNRRPPLDSSGGSYDPVLGIAGSDIEDSVRDDYYYSSPEDESYFLEQQFHEAYDTMHAERLNSMSKSDLLKEYLLIEKELESLRQKSPSSSTVGAGAGQGSTGDNGSVHLMISAMTKSPRPPSMPSSPRGQLLNARAHHHHHHCNSNSCSHHRGLFKENKHLRKLLKQVYSRYNSLMYCINYVNTTNTSSNSSEAGAMGYFDESAGGVGSTNSQPGQHQARQASSQQQQPPPVTPDDYQMTNEMHYRIEKYICHPSPSPLSSSSTGSSTSYTSSSSSSTSTSTSITSEDDVQELAALNRQPQEQVVRELLHELVDRVGG